MTCDTCKYVDRDLADDPCIDCSLSYTSTENKERHPSRYEGATEYTRGGCLAKANECVNGSRAEQYGELEDNFDTIATFWNGYLSSVMSLPHAHPLSPVDVANMMTLLKVARTCGNPEYADNYVDIAGYAACAYELSQRGE